MTAMHVDALLADAAESVQGKIYALGIGWNTIHVGSFPARHPRVSVVITVHVPYTQTNQMHRLKMHLETEDGDPYPLGDGPPSGEGQVPSNVLEVGGEFSVGRPAMLPPGDEQVVALAISIDGLTFEKPGMFSWVIKINGSEVRRLPMRVQHLVQTGPLR